MLAYLFSWAAVLGEKTELFCLSKPSWYQLLA